SRIRAAHLGHGHVHQNKIGSEVNGLLDSIQTVHGFATNLPFAARREEGAQGTPDYLVVVHNQNSQSLHSVGPHEMSSMSQKNPGKTTKFLYSQAAMAAQKAMKTRALAPVYTGNTVAPRAPFYGISAVSCCSFPLASLGEVQELSNALFLPIGASNEKKQSRHDERRHWCGSSCES